MPRNCLIFLIVALLAGVFQSHAQTELSQDIVSEELPAPPISLEHAFTGKLGDTLVIAGGTHGKSVYSLEQNASRWSIIGELNEARSNGSSAMHGDSLVLVGGTISGSATNRVTRLTVTENGLTIEELPPLPNSLIAPAAIVNSGKLIVAGGTTDGTDAGATNIVFSLNLAIENASWETNDSWNGTPRHSAFLVKSVETISLIGGIESDGSPANSNFSYHENYGWSETSSTQPEGVISSAVKLGDSHAAVIVQNTSTTASGYLYHTIGNTWISLGKEFENLPTETQLISGGTDFILLSNNIATKVTFGNPDTNYGWWDHISVAIYFALMIYVGVHFSKKKSTSKDFFRGVSKIPWWATGMSLFATGASAMSLMAMPGKSFSSNWTFFAISIYTIIALPLSMFLLAPLIRKLNFGTAFEYLEHRFGLSIRLLGSAIFAIGQILGRMGTVLLLPSFALEAIAGIPMAFSVPVMGLVTIAYTYLGGLAAVIWTDTIQGFVMIAAVAGCLILVLFKIEMPASEIWATLEGQSKLHIFDWGASITQENVLTVFLGIATLTLLGIGDQNYVQRVQCSRTLADTKKAIATQMGIAVPINLLLFALGTALFLFYKQQPAELNPIMRNDGIFPFFAAQQLPPGISGLVIAALLAATMSTVSSSICSVSNLAVDDFYKRFSRNPSEAKAISVGRVTTLIVGLFGIASAFYLTSFETPSIWDLFLRVASIISATTLGTFALGLFTKRSNEIGTLAGIVTGMAVTYLIAKDETIIFWLYPIFGSLVTFGVGYIVSLATGGNKKDIDGLTLHTLANRKGGLDD